MRIGNFQFSSLTRCNRINGFENTFIIEINACYCKFTFWFIVLSIIVLSTLLLRNYCSKPGDIPDDKSDWFEFPMSDLDTTVSAVDMSFLNPEEAGKSGFVTVNGSYFEDGSGTPIRFFGTNLAFSAAFPNKETAKQLAGKFRKMGYIVVRFHQLDMRAAPDGIWDSTMVAFYPEMVDRLL